MANDPFIFFIRVTFAQNLTSTSYSGIYVNNELAYVYNLDTPSSFHKCGVDRFALEEISFSFSPKKISTNLTVVISAAEPTYFVTDVKSVYWPT